MSGAANIKISAIFIRPIIDVANNAARYLSSKYKHFCHFRPCACTNTHNWGKIKGSYQRNSDRYIEGRIYWWTFASCTIRQRKVKQPGHLYDLANFVMFAAHHYIGARWLVAPMYWWIIERSAMLAAPPFLFVWIGTAYPSAAESRIQKYVDSRWRQNWKAKELRAPRSESTTSSTIQPLSVNSH